MSDLTILNGPITLWWAPVGTSFPAIDTDPGVEWTKIGTSGAENYSDDGVAVSLNQTVEMWRGLGSTVAKKAFRTEEDPVISVTMVDLTLDMVRLALNQNQVTDEAASTGTAGHRELNLERGLDVSTVALLARGVGKSPELAGANLQFEMPEVFEMASQELSWVKGDGVGVLLEFHALKDSNGDVGFLRYSHEAAT